jgi:hypothetical protein
MQERTRYKMKTRSTKKNTSMDSIPRMTPKTAKTTKIAKTAKTAKTTKPTKTTKTAKTNIDEEDEDGYMVGLCSDAICKYKINGVSIISTFTALSTLQCHEKVEHKDANDQCENDELLDKFITVKQGEEVDSKEVEKEKCMGSKEEKVEKEKSMGSKEETYERVKLESTKELDAKLRELHEKEMGLEMEVLKLSKMMNRAVAKKRKALDRFGDDLEQLKVKLYKFKDEKGEDEFKKFSMLMLINDGIVSLTYDVATLVDDESKTLFQKVEQSLVSTLNYKQPYKNTFVLDLLSTEEWYKTASKEFNVNPSPNQPTTTYISGHNDALSDLLLLLKKEFPMVDIRLSNGHNKTITDTFGHCFIHVHFSVPIKSTPLKSTQVWVEEVHEPLDKEKINE